MAVKIYRTTQNAIVVENAESAYKTLPEFTVQDVNDNENLY